MNAVAKGSRVRKKGLVLAQAKRIPHPLAGNTFYVPSAVDKGGYVVDTQKGTCTCPDFELRTLKCKHQWAISYARHEVTAADGSKIVTETMRVTYTQNWPAYNAAQCEEKERVQGVLRALCEEHSAAQRCPTVIRWPPSCATG